MTPCAERRARLCAQMRPGAVAIMGTAPEVTRNGDSDYPYRHDSSFYYLSGFGEPDAVLVLVAANADAPARSLLFCRQKNAEREIWDGFRYGPEAAREAFGFDAAFPIEELDAEVVKLLCDAPAVYYALGRDNALDVQMRTWLDAVRKQARAGIAAPPQAFDLPPLVEEMRLIKDASEQALMLRAATISGNAHLRAMRASRPGMFEYEIEAELLHEFRRNGAQAPAYPPIVAAGANACVLHYVSNRAQVQDGELVLIDAACEFDGYAADITRTYPVNGVFSAPQRILYELVLAAQEAALAAIRPGARYSDMHDAALRVLAQGMLDTGLLERAKFADAAAVIAERAHLQFYMHGTGHWLGMDVHDCGAYRESAAEGKPSRPLQAGMVVTVEPGIYVRPAPQVPQQYWNIGIRIEDDVLVTPEGCRVLSGAAPKLVADIEEAMHR